MKRTMTVEQLYWKVKELREQGLAEAQVFLYAEVEEPGEYYLKVGRLDIDAPIKEVYLVGEEA